MQEVVTWIFDHGEKIGGYLILLGMVYSFITGKLWSKAAVDSLRTDCEYHRQAHERILGELERAITVGKTLAEKQP